MAKSLGIQSELKPEPGLALGSTEVTLLEMTRAMDADRHRHAIDRAVYRAHDPRPAATLYTRPEAVADRPEWHGGGRR